MPVAHEEAFLGQMLNGRYRLDDIRLRGVFGNVFLAEEFFCRTFVRRVHVKLSRQTGMTELTAPYFFDDAIRLAQLQDRGLGGACLPVVLDMGLAPQCNGCGMLVTAAGDGTPLLTWQPQGQRPDLATQVKLFTELCRTLAALHGHGIIHRELRPQSVIINATGQACLLGLGLAAAADWQQAIAEAAPQLTAHLAPEILQGDSGPAADVYGLGLLLIEWLTGGGPHLDAPWGPAMPRGIAELVRLKQALHFAAPSVLRGEIRQTMSWLDEVALRCLEFDPDRRFRDAGQLLTAVEACLAGGALLPTDEGRLPGLRVAPLRRSEDATEQLIRDARRALARGQFDQAIDLLDIHRPAEWAVVDYQGAHVLRLLGQAYVRRGQWRLAQECLEQLRAAQREQRLLAASWYAAALTDLLGCYVHLGLSEPAEAIRQEARQLLLR